MTNEHGLDEQNDEVKLPADIAELLADESVWTAVDPQLEDAVTAAVMAEVHRVDDRSAGERHVPALGSVRSPNRRAAWRPALVGAAAMLLVLAGAFGIARTVSGTDSDFEVALAGTDLAPEASAIAEVTESPAGTRIVITVENLAPAAPGTYYQAWLRKDAEVGVSAGTFHLRDDEDEIELWAGVSPSEYPLLTVTLQQEAQTESSGQVVLKVLIGDQ